MEVILMQYIENMSMMTCINHRRQFKALGNIPPMQNDCDREICQENCPVKKMVKEQNDWMKKEFRQRMKEEKELLKSRVVLND